MGPSRTGHKGTAFKGLEAHSASEGIILSESQVAALEDAKVYNDKTAITAADTLNDRVLPYYDESGLRVHRILGDNGREYCGRGDQHPYELFLSLNDIEHTRTKPYQSALVSKSVYR